MTLDRNVVDAFRNDGATILRGVFSEFWIEELRAGIDVNMATLVLTRRIIQKKESRASFLVTIVTGIEYHTTNLSFLNRQQLR